MAGSIGRRSVLRMGLGAGLASALQACGGGGPSETVVAVGTVEGTDAFIGLVFDSTGVNVYVCDSETISAWFQGNVEDGTVEIDNGTAKLRAEVDDDGASGTFTDAAGESWSRGDASAALLELATRFRARAAADAATTGAGGVGSVSINASEQRNYGLHPGAGWLAP